MATKTEGTHNSFQLKGSLFTISVLHLLNADITAFKAQLTEQVKKTPNFFRHIPVVIDLQKLSSGARENFVDFAELIAAMREQSIIPVGVRGASTEQQNSAINAGLAIMPNAKGEAAEPSPPANPSRPSAPPPPPMGSKIVNQPVRSGQQIYARNADLIVLAPVSPGAELIADGHIHIYGSLKGRALAGVNGNQNARIFCQSLEAELVSIAGHYWISEDLHNSPLKQNVHIYLENDRLHVATY